ncbi:MAG: A/G-specific adenine glycosylase [Bdellovibrionales bacterium]|nr:A/G-specific adenine glycosylase [Bdellovibrionales bacterium]
MGKRLLSKKDPKRAADPGADAVRPVPPRALRGLVDWFGRKQRVLPWREEPTLYRVWISEIMLQQTQVATVLPYFERFMATFPTVGALARADEDAVMKAWAGLGYYSRARNLHAGAKAIVARGREGFPRTKEGWLEIPGVGPYTAGAITSIALGLPEPIVDGNVERVFARLRMLERSGSAGGGKNSGEAAYKAALWELSRSAVERAHADGLSPSDLNQAWMELGATVCTPKNPTCKVCPIRRECAAFAAERVSDFPGKKKRAKTVEVTEERVALVDARAGKVYVERIAAGEWRAGMWDFPKVPPAGFRAARGGDLGQIETNHVVTHHKITRRLSVLEGTIPGKAPGRWISLADPEVALGSAPKLGIRRIRERIG